MQNGQANIAIVGASGYSGIEATRILAYHPHVRLKAALSDRWAGEPVEKRIGPAGSAYSLKYAPQAAVLEACAGADAALLCTPHEVSAELAPKLLAAGVRVIDLSGSFRLREAALYPAHYKLTHPAPDLLASAVYGLPELFRKDINPAARLVANPGCYPTAAALAVAPLIEAGLLADEAVIVSAASGTTGAGRRATEDQSFAEVDGDFRAYKVLSHQHTPEIGQTLARLGKLPGLTFTAHLLPARRGILATCYARLAKAQPAGAALQALMHKYADEPFVRVVGTPEEVSLKSVVGTNRCVLSAAASLSGSDPGRIVVVAAIDNLVKGAAGQAVQNLNLVMGWPEHTGLDSLRGFHP